ncbi:MAG: hypothetical protein QOD01_136, partial [Actinomycetota bacterium]|nr:hypothetical protein [Actinomycetota bacterium]
HDQQTQGGQAGKGTEGPAEQHVPESLLASWGWHAGDML